MCISFSILLTVGIIAFLLVLFLLGKYRRTPSKIRLVVVIMILLMALAIIIDPITFVISRIVGQTIAQGNYIINLQGGFSFALIALSNILLGYFIHEVFYEKLPRTFVYVIAICEIPLIIILPVFAFLNMDLTLPLTAQLLISLIIYFGEFSAAYHLQKRLSAEHTNKADVRGIQAIGFSGILLTLTLICFIGQQYSPRLGVADSLGCSLFIPFGWICAGLSTFFISIGYFMPEWLKRRYSA